MRKTVTGIALGLFLACATYFTSVDALAFNTVDTAAVQGSTSSAQISFDNVVVSASFNKTPSSDDGRIYLFELRTYDYGIPNGKAPLDSVGSSSSVSFTIPLNYSYGCDGRLYNKFVMAVKRGGTWSLVTNAQYITNPEAVATDIKLREIRPVKVLCEGNVGNISLDGVPNGSGVATQHVVFTNTDPHVVTSDPHQSGDAYPVKANPVVAYMLNANDDAGIAGLVNDMTEYAGGLTYAQDFVIGNEVNQRCWNYAAYTDWDTYVRRYVQAFRVCYTAIKAANPNAMVYTSLDQVWNKQVSSTEYIDGKVFLDKFNSMINENGNIDWNLTIHPYPNPLYYAKFWDLSGLANGATFKAQVDNDQVLTFMNLSALTNVMTRSDYLNRYGMVRDIIIDEIGLGTNAGLDAQAAAICASWAAFERNPYITQYMYLEVDVNGFFPTMTGYSRECFDAMGTLNENKYMEWAKDYIGIADWSQVLR